LAAQIEKAIDLITIPKEFYDWAVDAIRLLNDQENTSLSHRLSDVKRRESELIQRLDRFILLRANGEISAERLSDLTKETERDLGAIRNTISQLHAKSIDWSKIANQYLTFAERAQQRFKEGGPDERRAILEGLSPNLTLKDKKLIIS